MYLPRYTFHRSDNWYTELIRSCRASEIARGLKSNGDACTPPSINFTSHLYVVDKFLQWICSKIIKKNISTSEENSHNFTNTNRVFETTQNDGINCKSFMAYGHIMLPCKHLTRLCHTPCFGNVKFDFTINRFDPHSTLRFKWWKLFQNLNTYRQPGLLGTISNVFHS